MDKVSGFIRELVLEQMDLSRDVSDEEIQHLIAVETARNLRGKAFSIKERMAMEKKIFDSLRKLDVLQDLVDDPEITEIMVNGPKQIFYEKSGIIYQSDRTFSSEEKLMDVLQQIVASHNRVVNLASPIVDTRLPDGSRVNIVLSPISIDGAAVSIRKFPKEPITMEQLIEMNSISQEAAEFLQLLVRAKYNIFISGGTSSGKTTFLNALSQFIPDDERLITIEDSAELQIMGDRNLIRLETRNSNQEGVSEISIRDLIRTALRMRPDRIIVGECRGAEAFDMIQSMTCGHDGSLSCGHGNSCKDMLSRLEMMILMAKELPLLAIRQQVASGIDILIHLARIRDRTRRVMDITEILEMQDGEIQLNPIFHFEEARDSYSNVKTDSDSNYSTKVMGNLVCVGKLVHKEKLYLAGLAGEERNGL